MVCSTAPSATFKLPVLVSASATGALQALRRVRRQVGRRRQVAAEQSARRLSGSSRWDFFVDPMDLVSLDPKDGSWNPKDLSLDPLDPKWGWKQAVGKNCNMARSRSVDRSFCCCYTRKRVAKSHLKAKLSLKIWLWRLCLRRGCQRNHYGCLMGTVSRLKT